MKLLNEYSVTWKYDTVILENFKKPIKTVETTCTLTDNFMDIENVGKVTKYSTDVFKKEKARKESFTKAIALMNVGKLTRTQLWEAYFNRNKN